MPYRLVRGDYVVVGGQPDGDSVRFRPRDLKLLKGFPQGDAKVSTRGPTKGTSQLRMEGLDALELHYLSPADHQQLKGARRARQALLVDLLGFQDVQFDKNEKVLSSVPPQIRGYILTNSLDDKRSRRPVSFLFTGPPGRADGSTVFVTPAMLTDSLNGRLLAMGEAYPLFYNTLPATLRDFLTGIVADARSDPNGRGLWPTDKSLKGIKATSKDDLKKYVFFPKLYRRLKDYFVETGAHSLGGFDSWVRVDPVNRDDAVWINPLRELRRLHSVYKVSGNRIKMLFQPEDLVFLSRGSMVAPLTRFP